MPAVRLFVGGHTARVQGEPQNLGGDRMFTAAHRPNRVAGGHTVDVYGLLDSGAFTDPPHKRLTPVAALDRQLTWERRASDLWGFAFQAAGLVSYDLLIDETWVAGERHKRRWDVRSADAAMGITVEAARYLAGERARLAPRTLILSCQGVDAYQYDDCAAEVLQVARPGDWIGLGGWCILGRQRRWMPTFWQTLRRVLPRIAQAGIGHVHIFGVLYQPALGGLTWLADQHGLTVSTDSTAPVLACTWRGEAKLKKAGARHPYWRDNVRWWIETLANLRETPHYTEPPRIEAARQETLV
ncbi:MAG TPA: hypothetical protein VFO85_17690 [Vicinamibacteria bacterium]|nr:hypothetical protein [Vicinamibacteria bacterium]